VIRGSTLLLVCLLGVAFWAAALPAAAQNPQSNADLLDELDAEIGSSPQPAAPKQGAGTSPPPADEDLWQELDQELGGPAKGARTSPPPADDDLWQELDGEVKGSSPEQETEDLWGDLEDAPAEQARPDSLLKKWGVQLMDNLSGTLSARHMHFWEKTSNEIQEGLDRQSGMFDTLLEADTFLAGDAWRLSTQLWLEAGNQKNTYAGVVEWLQDMDDRRRYLDVNELYLSLFLDDMDLLAGRKVLTHGLSTLYSPANRYGAAEGNDPLDPKAMGSWVAKVDSYHGASTYTLEILPVPQQSKTPDATSRWLAGGDDFLFRNLPSLGTNSTVGGLLGGNSTEIAETRIEEDVPEINDGNVSYIGQFKTVYRGWDLFLLGYHGLNPYPVLQQKSDGDRPVFIKKTVHVGNVAGGFSTTFGKWELHGEALYSYAYKNMDDIYLDYVGGFTYTIEDLARKIGLDTIRVTAEYAGEWIQVRQSAGEYIESSEQVRPGKNDILGLFDFKVNEDLSLKVAVDFERSDDGQFERYQASYKLSPETTLSVAFDHFSGDDDSYFGRWERNNRMIWKIEHAF
jgi:hypothetical protein